MSALFWKYHLIKCYETGVKRREIDREREYPGAKSSLLHWSLGSTIRGRVKESKSPTNRLVVMHTSVRQEILLFLMLVILLYQLLTQRFCFSVYILSVWVFEVLSFTLWTCESGLRWSNCLLLSKSDEKSVWIYYRATTYCTNDYKWEMLMERDGASDRIKWAQTASRVNLIPHLCFCLCFHYRCSVGSWISKERILRWYWYLAAKPKTLKRRKQFLTTEELTDTKCCVMVTETLEVSQSWV